MVRDRERVVAAAHRFFGHRSNGKMPVACGCMRMQIAGNIRKREQRGGRYFDCVPFLPQFGWMEGEIERGVDVFFGCRCDRSDTSLLRRFLLSVIRKQAVLVQPQRAGLSEVPQFDVVFLGPGEVHAGGTNCLGVNDSQVDLDAVLESNRSLCVARGEYLGDTGRLRERLDQRRRVVTGRQQIDVADGLTPTAERPGILDAVDARQTAEFLKQQFGQRQGDANGCPLRRLLGELK